MDTVDPDRTIDGEAQPRPQSDKPPPATDGADYPELVAVERAHYQIAGVLAKGGMGRVLQARDLRLGRDVAIKELLPQHRDAARRFEREARITARLQHPAIIHVYEAGVWPGGEPFYAMPIITGRSLDKVVAERATLNDRLGLLPTAIAVADALAYAHSQRVIHRDLKPSNVLVGDFGETVVIDWGLAKDLGAPKDASDAKESLVFRTRSFDQDTVSGSVVGTPAYMPPEQARGEIVDQRADVYALGALLYKLLAGSAPYVGESSADVLEQVKAGPPQQLDEREPGAPPPLVAIVDKAMARDPSARYATAAELAQDLKRFQTGQLVAAHRYTSVELVRRWLRRYRVIVAAALVLAVVGVVSVRRIVVERARAQANATDADHRRINLLEERGRTELLAGEAGKGLAYLVRAAADGATGGARGFLIADAMRPFEAQLAKLTGGPLVATSSDGKLVATAGKTVSLWTDEGKRVAILADKPRPIHALVFDPAGTHVAAGGDDDVAWVWGIDGKLVALLHTNGAIWDVAFSPDGKRIVTVGDAGLAIVWDIASQKAIATSSCHHHDMVTSARFSPDGNSVATGSIDATGCVWSADSGVEITSLRGGHTARVSAVAWLDDKRVVTAGADGTARVWHARGGKLVISPLHHERDSEVVALAVSSDGQLLVTAGADGMARVWKMPPMTPEDGTTTPPRQIATLAGHAGAIVAVAFSPDDSLIATAGTDRLAKVWDAASGRVRSTFEHASEVSSVAFLDGGARLATGTNDGRSWIWNTRVTKVDVPIASPIHALAASRDGTIAAGADNSSVVLVRKTGGTTVLAGHLGRVFAAAFTPDGKRLVTGGDDLELLVWDVATGKLVMHLGPTLDRTNGIQVSPDGTHAAAATKDGVQLWSLATGKRERTLEDQATTIDAVAFGPGATVFGGTENGQVVVWGLSSGMPRDPVVLPGGGVVGALAVSPDGKWLAVAVQATVELFPLVGDHIGTRESVALHDPQGGMLRALAWSADSTRIITGGSGGARIWELTRRALLGRRDAGAINALALENDTLWIGGDDGTVEAWDVRVETRGVSELEKFAGKYDPWELGKDDIPVRKGDTQ